MIKSGLCTKKIRAYFGNSIFCSEKPLVNNSKIIKKNIFDSEEMLLRLKCVCFCMPLLVDFADIYFDFMYVYNSYNRRDQFIHTDFKIYMVMLIFGFAGIGKFLIYGYLHIVFQQENPMFNDRSQSFDQKAFSPEVTKMVSKLTQLWCSFVLEDGWEIFIQYFWFDKFTNKVENMILLNALMMLATSGLFYCQFYKISYLVSTNALIYILMASPILCLHLLRLIGAIIQQFKMTIADGCLNYQNGYIWQKRPFNQIAYMRLIISSWLFMPCVGSFVFFRYLTSWSDIVEK